MINIYFKVVLNKSDYHNLMAYPLPKSDYIHELKPVMTVGDDIKVIHNLVTDYVRSVVEATDHYNRIDYANDLQLEILYDKELVEYLVNKPKSSWLNQVVEKFNNFIFKIKTWLKLN